MVAYFINLVALVAELFELLATCANEIAAAEAQVQLSEERFARFTRDADTLLRRGANPEGRNALDLDLKKANSQAKAEENEVTSASTLLSQLRESCESRVDKARLKILNELEKRPGGVTLVLDKPGKLVTVMGSPASVTITERNLLKKHGISAFPGKDVVALLAENYDLPLDREAGKGPASIRLVFDFTTGEVKKWAPQAPTKKKG
jgi:hypothetical protein